MSKASRAIAASLVIGVAGVVLSALPLGLDLEESLGLDLLFRLRGDRDSPSEVVIVSLDSESAEKLGQSPDPDEWSRSLHASLIGELARQGAAAITFDVHFKKPRSQQETELLADAMRDAGNVILNAHLEPQKGYKPETIIPPVPPLAESAFGMAPFPLPELPPFKAYHYWIVKRSAGDMPSLPVLAFQTFALEFYDEFVHLLKKVGGSDEIISSQIAQLPPDKRTVTESRGVARLIPDLKDLFRSNPQIADAMREELHLTGSLEDGRKRATLAALIAMYEGGDYNYLNYYGNAGRITTIPYHKMMERTEPSSVGRTQIDVKGKVVFVGCPGRMSAKQEDEFLTPLSRFSGEKMRGVEIAATAFANLADGMPIQHGEPKLVVFLMGAILGVVCILVPRIALTAVSAGLLGSLYLYGLHLLFKHNGLWYPLVIPLFFQAPAAFLGASLWEYLDRIKERNRLRATLGRYLPANVLDELAERPDSGVSDQAVYGTILYTDAQDSTSLSEGMEPRELKRFMDGYYKAIFGPVYERGGVVSDVIGDAVMAVWAKPDPDMALRNNACLAALDIGKELDRFSPSSDAAKLPTRIGLHAGEFVLGEIGAIRHYEYRPFGDIVITATRIEGLNKHLGTRVLVSEEVLYELDGFLTRELGRFYPKGKKNPVAIHELMCRRQESTSRLERLCGFLPEALRAWNEQSWDEAIKVLRESMKVCSQGHRLCEACGGDPGIKCPELYYLNMCEAFKRNPPDDTWDGVIRMDAK